MKVIKKTNDNKLVSLIKKLQYCLAVTTLFTLITACSTSNNNVAKQLTNDPIAENTELQAAPLKGPYQLAEEENIPSVVSYQTPQDSLRFINEPIFNFNDSVYHYVMTPLAKGYENIVPKPIDKSIRNFFYNLREPLYALNHLLQGDITKSGKSIARVLVNSTIGIFGLFDPANAMMEIERDKTTFGETLATYGIGHGAYIVLPFLGPSDLRDTASLSFNYFAHPLNFINDEQAAQQLLLFDGVHSQTPILVKYPRILSDVDNRYEFTRNLYMQSLQRDGQARRNEVFETEKLKQLATSSAEE